MKNWFWKLVDHFSYNLCAWVMKKIPNSIFCYPLDSRKILSIVGKLEDTVNLTLVRWCLKVSAKALCSLGKIFLGGQVGEYVSEVFVFIFDAYKFS